MPVTPYGFSRVLLAPSCAYIVFMAACFFSPFCSSTSWEPFVWCFLPLIPTIVTTTFDSSCGEANPANTKSIYIWTLNTILTGGRTTPSLSEVIGSPRHCNWDPCSQTTPFFYVHIAHFIILICWIPRFRSAWVWESEKSLAEIAAEYLFHVLRHRIKGHSRNADRFQLFYTALLHSASKGV